MARRAGDTSARRFIEGYVRMGWVGSAAVLLAGLLLASCRFIPTADVPALARRNVEGAAVPFDPDKKAASIWSSKVEPYFDRKAGPFLQVRDLAAKSPDAAGAKFGYRSQADDTPWTMMVRIEGVIVGANTQSRAATIGIDASGQGKTDAIVQIGPAIRGAAIRDALDFVSFNDFTNQIDFAQFGKALNAYVDHETLAKLPRDSLIGRKVSILGAYPFVSAADTPLVTPVEITLGPKP
jgi:predicted lipoprotein